MNAQSYRATLSLLFCLGSWLAMGNAQAAFQIRISDGASSSTIVDNGVDDLSGDEGVLAVAKSYGWGDLAFTAGISKPEIGGANAPQLSLSGVRTTFFQPIPKEITIELTDTDFTGAPGGLDPATFTTTVEGTTSGSVSLTSFVDSSNAEFGKAEQLGSEYQYSHSGGGASEFSAGSSSSANVSAPFSITMQAIVSHGQVGATHFDARLQADDMHAVPEPISMVAWLALAPVLGLAARRRNKRKSVR